MSAFFDSDFQDDPSVLHLELGAKCGDFGRLYFPSCYLTDLDESLRGRCVPFQIDVFCSATSIPWPNDRFHLVIICNPWEYGFKDRENAMKLLNELTRVLVSGGRVLILSSKINPWGAADRVKERVHDYSSATGVDIGFASEEIDPWTEYPGFQFQQTINKATFPKERTVLHVRK